MSNFSHLYLPTGYCRPCGYHGHRIGKIREGCDMCYERRIILLGGFDIDYQKCRCGLPVYMDTEGIILNGEEYTHVVRIYKYCSWTCANKKMI